MYLRLGKYGGNECTIIKYDQEKKVRVGYEVTIEKGVTR